MRTVLFSLILPMVVGEDNFHLCQTDPVCRALYHQYPPNRATFDHIWNQGTDGNVATIALRARVAPLHICPMNEQYIVDPSGRGACRCVQDTCHGTPLNNTIITVACVSCTLFLLCHVIHGFHRTLYKAHQNRK